MKTNFDSIQDKNIFKVGVNYKAVAVTLDTPRSDSVDA